MDSNALAPEEMRKRRQEAQEKVPRLQLDAVLGPGFCGEECADQPSVQELAASNDIFTSRINTCR